MNGCAVYIPVGPSAVDLIRVNDLIDSLAAYERCIKLIVLVDHGPKPRDMSHIVKSADFSVVVLRHQPQVDNGTWLGAGCVTNLVSLAFIASKVEVDFVLKLDTDALIINKFADQVAEAFRSHDDWGIAGSLGETSNRALRTKRFDDDTRRLVERAVEMSKRVRSSPEGLQNADIITWNLFTEEQRETFQGVCNELSEAIRHGFAGDHCQGGAYAISWRMVLQLKAKGVLDNPLRWLYLPIGEDRMMGAYCAALKMKLGDLCGIGEPFAVQYRGLPFVPEELILRRNSIIHSLRNNNCGSEESLREFFRGCRRRAAFGASKVLCE